MDCLLKSETQQNYGKHDAVFNYVYVLTYISKNCILKTHRHVKIFLDEMVIPFLHCVKYVVIWGKKIQSKLGYLCLHCDFGLAYSAGDCVSTFKWIKIRQFNQIS